MSKDDIPTLESIAAEWGHDEISRVVKTYGSLSSPGAKDVGRLLKPFKVERGETVKVIKTKKGGLVKGLDDLARLTELRIIYLTLTLDMGMEQKLARAEIAKMYELSKSRVRQLVSVPKDKTSKK